MVKYHKSQKSPGFETTELRSPQSQRHTVTTTVVQSQPQVVRKEYSATTKHGKTESHQEVKVWSTSTKVQTKTAGAKSITQKYQDKK